MDELIRRGHSLRAALSGGDPASTAAAETRLWQHDCETAIQQLSGGHKAHWLSRAYSDALLVRSAGGGAPERADLATIVDRILAVLQRAAQALAQAPPPVGTADLDRPTGHRFDFVHDAALRPVVEETYLAGRQALDERRYDDALLALCSTLEAVITDALVHRNPDRTDHIRTWSFDARIAAAEEAGLIRNGCRRLPGAARAYRQSGTVPGADERDARTAGQVLRTVMRDLDPGR